MTHKENALNAIIQVLSDDNLFCYSEAEAGIKYSAAIITCCVMDERFDQEIDRCISMFFGDRVMNSKIERAIYITEYGQVEISGMTEPALDLRVIFRSEAEIWETQKMSDKTGLNASDKKEE